MNTFTHCYINIACSKLCMSYCSRLNTVNRCSMYDERKCGKLSCFKTWLLAKCIYFQQCNAICMSAFLDCY